MIDTYVRSLRVLAWLLVVLTFVLALMQWATGEWTWHPAFGFSAAVMSYVASK